MSPSLGERREVVLREPVSEGPTRAFISEKRYSHPLGNPRCLKTDTERDQPVSCWEGYDRSERTLLLKGKPKAMGQRDRG